VAVAHTRGAEKSKCKAHRRQPLHRQTSEQYLKPFLSDSSLPPSLLVKQALITICFFNFPFTACPWLFLVEENALPVFRAVAGYDFMKDAVRFVAFLIIPELMRLQRGATVLGVIVYALVAVRILV
jgi:hypothetical protein